MKTAPGLDTIKKISMKSGVGFGTVRRARNGDGNITVTNLAAIAHAFGRQAVELITPASAGYAATPSREALMVAENIPRIPKHDPHGDYCRELIALTDAMNDQGRWQLIGQAKLLATSHPKAKANPAN